MLTFTVYQLLSALTPTLKSGDLDPCMNMLIDVSSTSFRNIFSFYFFVFILIPVPLLHSPPLCYCCSTDQIFNNELFGTVAEEKEVKGIISKLMEARHSKSMDSYELLAQFCSKESITKLILPLKEVRRGLNLETEDNW